MVSEPASDAAAISGKAAPRAMVLTPFRNIEDEKTISSLAALALAKVIASLNEIRPSSGILVSVAVVTV
jgi:hypothetical protein